jgi:hypothetical protein
MHIIKKRSDPFGGHQLALATTPAPLRSSEGWRVFIATLRSHTPAHPFYTLLTKGGGVCANDSLIPLQPLASGRKGATTLVAMAKGVPNGIVTCINDVCALAVIQVRMPVGLLKCSTAYDRGPGNGRASDVQMSLQGPPGPVNQLCQDLDGDEKQRKEDLESGQHTGFK